MEANFVMLGQRVPDEGEQFILAEEQFDTFGTDEICYIDIYSPKKNYNVPRFHTFKGIFTVPLTLEALKISLNKYGIIPMDSTNLVNVSNIDHVIETTFAITAYFRNGYCTNVARNKRGMIKHLIKRA